MRLRSPRIMIATALVAVAIPVGAAGGAMLIDGPPGSPDNPLVAPPLDPSVVAAADRKGHLNEAKAPSAAVLQEAALSQKPCTLVSEADVGNILGAAVTAKTAPLGPTCVFRAGGTAAKGFATVAIQTLSGDQVKAIIKSLATVGVPGRTAYCGASAASTLYVPLPGNRVLTIGALDCDVARRLAGKALVQISGTP